MKKAIATLLISFLGLALMIYSAVRGLDFVTETLPPDKAIFAFFALAATEGGLLLWTFYYLEGATGAWQKGISLLLIAVDLVGAIALFTADTLLRSGESGLIVAMTPEEILSVILGLSGLIALNVAAIIGAHLTNPEKQLEAAQGEASDAIEEHTLKEIKKNSKSLAAELAPIRAAAWVEQERARYNALLGSGLVFESKKPALQMPRINLAMPGKQAVRSYALETPTVHYPKCDFCGVSSEDVISLGEFAICPACNNTLQAVRPLEKNGHKPQGAA